MSECRRIERLKSGRLRIIVNHMLLGQDPTPTQVQEAAGGKNEQNTNSQKVTRLPTKLMNQDMLECFVCVQSHALNCYCNNVEIRCDEYLEPLLVKHPLNLVLQSKQAAT